MAMVFTRGKTGEVQRKSPCQDGGKGWRDVAISQGMLRLARERRKEVPELTPSRMLNQSPELGRVAHFLLSVRVNTSGDPVKPHTTWSDSSYSGSDSGKGPCREQTWTPSHTQCTGPHEWLLPHTGL